MFLDISCDLHGIDNGRKLACEKMEEGLKAVLQTERLILRPWEDDEKLWELFPISLTEPSEKVGAAISEDRGRTDRRA